jgi:hypothetical protein
MGFAALYPSYDLQASAFRLARRLAHLGMTSRTACAMRDPMITVATSYFWYFSYDSSLAVGGSRSI